MKSGVFLFLAKQGSLGSGDCVGARHLTEPSLCMNVLRLRRILAIRHDGEAFSRSAVQGRQSDQNHCQTMVQRRIKLSQHEVAGEKLFLVSADWLTETESPQPILFRFLGKRELECTSGS